MDKSTELFIKISHNIVENPKIATLSYEARWAYLESLVYAARNFTDGLIDRRILHQRWPDHVIEELTHNDEKPSWIMLENGDVEIYAFCEWQMTSEKREQIREKKRQAGIKSGAVRRETNKTRTSVQNVFEHNVNKNELELEVEIEKEIELKPLATTPPLFDEFWKLWPRKDGKANAIKAWLIAVQKLPAVDLVEAARDYSLRPDLPKDKTFIPHASTWLNGERWQDEVPVARHHPPEDDWMYEHQTIWKSNPQ